MTMKTQVKKQTKRMEIRLKPEIDNKIRKLAKVNKKTLSDYVEGVLVQKSDFRNKIKIINFRLIQSGKLLAKCDIQYGRLIISGFKVFGGNGSRIGVKPPQEKFDHKGEVKYIDVISPSSADDEIWFAKVKEAVLREYLSRTTKGGIH